MDELRQRSAGGRSADGRGGSPATEERRASQAADGPGGSQVTTDRPGRRPPPGFVPFHTPVRGYRFAARPPDAEHPRPGQRVGLVRERAHPVDPWATSVWLRSGDGTPWRIGYLERAVAARLGPHLDRGEPVRAEVAGWQAERARPWRRPVVLVQPDANRGTGVRNAGPLRP